MKKNIILNLTMDNTVTEFLAANVVLENVISVATTFGDDSSKDAYNILQKEYPVVHYGAEKALMSDRSVDYQGMYPDVVQNWEPQLLEHEQIEMISYGPLTNIATLLLTNPERKKNIATIHIIGGVLFEGNYTMSAEKYLYLDPEATKIVLNAGVNIKLYTLDSTYFVNGENVVSKVYRGILEKEESLCTPVYADIDLQGEYTRGSLIIDYTNTLRKVPNISLIER